MRFTAGKGSIGLWHLGTLMLVWVWLAGPLPQLRAQHGQAPEEFPQGYFRSPLDVPLHLSGNFGELRTNHFHAGLDIKTQQREGLPIYAVAEGYVSRIKVSPFGYGYALYIDHPNGYTSVYGHLQKYADPIASYVLAEQYKLESFSIDLFPEPGKLPVTKGQLVALSGNSGGSGGPHLHFEIRETRTEKLVNPMLFGFDIRDKINPSILSVMIIPMNETSSVSGASRPVTLQTKVHSGKCSLVSSAPVNVHGDIGFAVTTYDLADGNANKCGIYRIELRVDGLLVYAQRMDKLDFSTTRAMNAHTIYEIFKKNRTQLHRSYRLPNNMLDIYDNLVNDGILYFQDDKLHQVEYKVTDIKGNTSTLQFQVKSIATPRVETKKFNTEGVWFDFEKDNYYEDKSVRISVNAFSLYEDLQFEVNMSSPMKGHITPTYLIADPYVPVNGHYELSIQTGGLPEKLQSKAVVVRWDPEKEKNIAEPGTYENGWMRCETQYFGYFGVMVDTLPPYVSSVDFAPALRGKSKFSMKIGDSLSGIDQIIPKIDGKWALMEYDAKNSRLTYYFDEKYISHGSHTFELEVIDAVGNSKVYKGNFDW